MTEKKNPSVATPAAAKPPKKLVPRVATPAKEAALKVDVPPVAPPVSATAPGSAKARPPRKPSRVDETVARHQKVLAEALVKAQAIKYDEAPVTVKAAAAKGKTADKPVRPKKIKLVRDSYAMPEAEYAQIAVLKKRLAGLGRDAKKSEVLRGGLLLLAALNDAELTAVMGRVERIKTGRPAK
ncbi:MAG: hypothetical protein ACM3X0_04775 [Bacteroidota bacterium]